MRIPLTLSLTILIGAAAHAGPPLPKRKPRPPAAPLAAARGVARPLLPAAPEAPPAPPAKGEVRKAPARDTVIPPPPARVVPPPTAPSLPSPPPSGAAPVPPAAAAAKPTAAPAAKPTAAPPAKPAQRSPAPPASPPQGAPAANPAPRPGTQPPAPGIPPVLLPPPPLMLSSARAVVPIGETRVITVTGTLQAPEATPSSADVVTATVGPGPLPGSWSVTLHGVAPGEATVHVTAGDREQLLTARVMKYAGLVAPAAIEVTGQPAPTEHVLRAARLAIGDAVKPEPGATLTVGRPTTAVPELPAGQVATLNFPVTLTGPDLLPLKTVASVTVRNRDVDRREVEVLFYSNDPERVENPGSLFAAELTSDHPARLLYHHLNAGKTPLRLRVELINPTDQPADAQVIEGLAGPTWDPVEAGHRAAARYLRSAVQEIGSIVRVPAQSQQTITLQRLAPENTVSGLLTLRSLGAKLFVRVVAELDTDPAVAVRPAETPTELSDHVYASPRRPLKARYVVGGNWVFLKLGGDPVVGRGSHKKLDGNYGVSYDMAIEISNPTSQPQEVSLTLSPDAGHARGVFLIDGAIVEAEPVTPPVEAALATFRLQPGERRAVHVETIPVGGSSYPARVVVRPTRPLRAAQTPVDPH